MDLLQENDKLIKAIELSEYDYDHLSIGMMKEHRLHRVLKYYLSSDPGNHEIQYGKMYADVVIDNHIYEIQTKAFNYLKSKLSVFLKDHEVTIVHPVISNKNITVITNREDRVRKSPKHKTIFDCFNEFCMIRDYLENPRLHFMLILMDAEEIRTEVDMPKKRRRRKNYAVIDHLPTNIIDVVFLNKFSDIVDIIKQYDIPDEFNSRTLAKILHVSVKSSQMILYVLNYLGYVKRISRNKNGYLYTM